MGRAAGKAIKKEWTRRNSRGCFCEEEPWIEVDKDSTAFLPLENILLKHKLQIRRIHKQLIKIL